MSSLAFMLPGGWEWFVILAIGLLIFGKRLPEVGRSVGKSIVEFKKGIKDVSNEIEVASDGSSGYNRGLSGGSSSDRLPASSAPSYDAGASSAESASSGEKKDEGSSAE